MPVGMILNTSTPYVTIEYIDVLHAAFIADKTWGDKLEPARTWSDIYFTSLGGTEGLGSVLL